jgi:DNA-binding XRE family transcriptional regulator
MTPKKTVTIAREIIAEQTGIQGRAPGRCAIWVFPPRDFAAWRKLVGPRNADKTYSDYMARIAAVQADIERQGGAVVRVPCTVARMKRELRRRGLKNAPGERAAIIASLASPLAANIRAQRKRLGIQQGELARAAGVSQTTMSLIESGRERPSLDLLERLAKALGTTPGRLLDDSGA